MLNLKEIVENVEKERNMTKEEKENFEKVAFAFGNFFDAMFEISNKNRKE